MLFIFLDWHVASYLASILCCFEQSLSKSKLKAHFRLFGRLWSRFWWLLLDRCRQVFPLGLIIPVLRLTRRAWFSRGHRLQLRLGVSKGVPLHWAVQFDVCYCRLFVGMRVFWGGQRPDHLKDCEQDLMVLQAPRHQFVWNLVVHMRRWRRATKST